MESADRPKPRYILDMGPDARADHIQFMAEALKKGGLEEFLAVGGGNFAIHDLQTGKTLHWTPPLVELTPQIAETSPYVPLWLWFLVISSCLLSGASLLLAIFAIIRP